MDPEEQDPSSGDPLHGPASNEIQVTTVDEDGDSLQDEALSDAESQGSGLGSGSGVTLLPSDYVDLTGPEFCRVHFERTHHRKTVPCVCGNTLPCRRPSHGDLRAKGGTAVAPPGFYHKLPTRTRQKNKFVDGRLDVRGPLTADQY